MQGISVRSAELSVLPGAVWRAAFARDDGREPPGRSEPYAQGDPGGHFPPEVLRALPAGFTGRIVARSGERTGGVVWHAAPDGGGCFPDGDGWIYVSNCALPLLGGVTALRFAPDGTLRDGYRVLSGADRSGAGAATPWNTWVSGERTPYGRVFECDPYGLRAPMPRLAMGLFLHGGVACDSDRGVLYLTEGEPDGCLYRFRPDDWGDLTTGVLEVMIGAPGEEAVAWERVPTPATAQVPFGEHVLLAGHMPIREQVKGVRRFARGGDCHYRDGLLRFVTEGDGRVWAYDAARERLTVAHDTAGQPGGGKDGEITLVAADRAVPFLRVTGGWTVAGPAMSPAGDRLYFSCRPPHDARSAPASVTVEVRGPFQDLVRA
ncbi:alkaline phosphatase PhoX [Microbispora sp. H10836]|uniref:alkaline phosphatase PhoX n=1 Tax=Microbispora sp. H10836 TaxID=2729106 RepID=UPI002892F46E|nr:alkaline phosphatase PhoX [Microbispora sp. H10836]